MSVRNNSSTSVVIGGGFYGVNIALFLAQQKKQRRVIVLEKSGRLLTRASYHNQARIHNGYHYPRSFTTAFRSRVNFPRFVQDWPSAVKTDFKKIYAIARNNSKVNPTQFERFCQEIGAKLEPADEFSKLFNPKLITKCYMVEEYAFDTTVLANWAKEQLESSGVEVIYDATAKMIEKCKNEGLTVFYEHQQQMHELQTNEIFNCTYSGLNQFGGEFVGTHTHLKHEITEMALMKMPPSLENLGVTVMDGPFFSIMPFPARALHTLSHVRYTPHLNWIDIAGVDPYKRLDEYEKQTRVDRMVRDVQRYIPEISHAIYHDSLFEVKTILTKSETDDSRPILFEEYPNLPRLYSVLGGKIDNIYDVLERLDKLYEN